MYLPASLLAVSFLSLASTAAPPSPLIPRFVQILAYALTLKLLNKANLQFQSSSAAELNGWKQYNNNHALCFGLTVLDFLSGVDLAHCSDMGDQSTT